MKDLLMSMQPGNDLRNLRDILSSAAIFNALSDAQLEDLRGNLSLMTVPKGSTVLSSGQINAQMYVLLAGKLRVHLGAIDSEPIAIVKPGEVVGELSVIDQRPTCAHVIAQEPSTIARLDEAGFWSLVSASHHFALQLMHKLAERLRANNTAVVESAQLRDQFKRAALFDALTGIHNRRWLEDTLPLLVERHLRAAFPFCVAMVDVDHFKLFNDNHGHDAGDAVLKAVAATIREQLRPSDAVARFGGEEFVVIFPETDLTGAHCAAERLRKAVENQAVLLAQGEYMPKVTVSVGLAKMDATNPSNLLQMADEAMYRAKRNGRNRIECAPTDAGCAMEPPGRLQLDNAG